MIDVFDGTLLIDTYAEAREVLNDEQRFSQASKRESADFLGGTVLTLDGDDHFERRRLLSRLVRHRLLERFETEVIDPTVIALLDELESAGDGFDLVEYARRVFLRLATALIGLDRMPDLDDHEVLTRYLYPLIEAVTMEWSPRPNADIHADGMVAMDGYLAALVGPAIDRRRALLADGAELPGDLISLMVASGFEDAPIHREAVLFLNASTLNNATTLTHAVDETFRWVADGGATGIEPGPRLVRRIVNETLRTRVVTPAVFREARVDTRLDSGREVPAGSKLSVRLPEANHDTTVWGPDADRFDPLRTIPAGEKPYGLAFGAGVHACLGRPLVLGSYSDDLTAGMLGRILSTLLGAGIAPDPDRPPTLADSAARRFERYPVRRVLLNDVHTLLQADDEDAAWS